MTDAEIETLIRAGWQRDGVPGDVMDGGHRTVTAWERSAYRTGLEKAAQECENNYAPTDEITVRCATSMIRELAKSMD